MNQSTSETLVPTVLSGKSDTSFGREFFAALRFIPRYAWIGLALAFLVRFVLAWLPPEISHRLTVPDDGYYYFTIARNVAQGAGATFDGVTPTNGFHPLWLSIIVPFWLIVDVPLSLPVQLSLSLGAVFDVVTALGVWYLALSLTRSRTVAALGLLLYSWNPYQIAASVNGLETSLAAMLFVISVGLYWRLRSLAELSGADWLTLSTTWALLFLARTDYLIVILPCLLDLLWRQRGQLRTGWVALLAGLLILPWIGWNLVTFGSIIQVSSGAYPYYLREIWRAAHPTTTQWLAKELILTYGLAANLARLAGFSKALPILGLAIALLTILNLRTPEKVPTFLVVDRTRLLGLIWPTIGALTLLLLHGLVRWMYNPWYFVTLTILLVLWFTLVISLIQSRNAVIAVAIGVAVVLFQLIHGTALLRAGGMWPAQGQGGPDGLQVLLQDCEEYSVLGFTDSGYAGYFLPCRVVNLDGVVNNQAYEAIVAGRFRNYLDEAGIRKVRLNEIIRDVVTLKEGNVPTFAPFSNPDR